jgi:hypothetical protein
MYEELIGKTLPYVLKKIENDTIKICTEHGTNFWYVGSKDAFMSKMSLFTKKLKERFRKTYEVKEFVPLSQRIVVDIFDAAPCVDNSTVIYITGNETGNMWFVGEKPDMENGNNLLLPQVHISESFLMKRKRGRYARTL